MPENPFRPGAGHMPPYLAGRDGEQKEFIKILSQDVILENLILTGLRGVGKTVLSDTFKPLAITNNWLWAGSDLSETVSVSEDRICLRLITDLAIAMSSITIERASPPKMLSPSSGVEKTTISFEELCEIYNSTPGLPSDKIKAVLEYAWPYIKSSSFCGVVFAYDESQNLSDDSSNDQYPLSLILDVFQSLQKKGMKYLLVLVGLPTLFPKLVDARTFSERMFHVITLGKLEPKDARDAISKPIKEHAPEMLLDDQSIELISSTSGGYPYFIQFICREAYDIFIQQSERNEKLFAPMTAIVRKLDADFFSGRWSKVTDRQRVLLWVAAHLDNCDGEFTVQEIVQKSKEMGVKEFSGSHANQILTTLCNAGLVYKTPRHGKYQFAVPLLPAFILRQEADIETEALA